METKKITLYSLNQEEYPNIEIECAVVEDMTEFTKKYLDYLRLEKNEQPKVAKKTAQVEAVKGGVGQEVDTRVRVRYNGKLYVLSETKGTVKVEESMIVKNPDGEEYIVKPDKFDAKYEKTENEGKYLPKGDAIKCVIVDKPIVFTAPWGEEMVALEGAALNVTNVEDVYAIQNEAFDKTYEDISVTQKEITTAD